MGNTVETPIGDEQILAELNKLRDLGAVDYVLPTEPLGEEWVVGVEGQILKMTGGEAIAFLAGASAAARLIARRQGLL